MKKTAEKPIRKRRPFGIWALTVFAVVIAGVLPILSVISLFIVPGSTLEVASVITIAYTLAVSVVVIISSAGAWLGRNWARKLLMVFIALFFAPQVITSLIFIFFYKDPEASSSVAQQQILQGVLTVAIYIWYFNRARIKDFYGVGTGAVS